MQDAVSEKRCMVVAIGVLEALPTQVPILCVIVGVTNTTCRSIERKQLIADKSGAKILHAKNISADLLTHLREQYFGDPQNGKCLGSSDCAKNSKLL